jgi:hypothetical protein
MSDDQNTSPAVPPAIDIEKRVGQFVKLRDLKAELEEKHKEELKPINAALDMLKQVMAQGLDQLNVDSAKTSCGTVSFSSKASAALADKSAFWTYVVTTGQFELLDYKANVTAVKEHIEKNQGNAPPGVNFSVFRDVGVRRPTGK